MKIKLGNKYKDPITGFEGTATARIEYLWGCVQFEIRPFGVDKDGKVKESAWFDESRLVDLENTPAEKPSRGGPPPSSVPSFSHP